MAETDSSSNEDQAEIKAESLMKKSIIVPVNDDPRTWINYNIFKDNKKEQDHIRQKFLQKLGLEQLNGSETQNGQNNQNCQEEEEKCNQQKTEKNGDSQENQNSQYQQQNNIKQQNEMQANKEKELLKQQILNKQPPLKQTNNQLMQNGGGKPNRETNNFQINFLERNDDEVRNNYLNKLINTKILRIEPMKKQQSLIIFDYDDTLLCTSFLGSLGFIDLEQDVLEQIKPLDNIVSKLLQIASEYGDIFIITNAAQGWVEYSSKFFLPKANEILTEKKINVISARSGYENMFPGDCSKWKNEAFLKVRQNYNENIITNIICLGDSHIEMEAAHNLAKQFNKAMIKTIKFRENPRPEELVKQQELVLDKFEQIFMSLRNLTIRLEKKGNQKD